MILQPDESSDKTLPLNILMLLLLMLHSVFYTLNFLCLHNTYVGWISYTSPTIPLSTAVELVNTR